MPLRGERLKQIRTMRGYSQKSLAEALGTVQQQVAKWEIGMNDPSSDTLTRLVTILHCSTDWLLGLVDQPDEQLQVPGLSADERQLVDLYRRGALPELITRLVTEMSQVQPKKDLTVDGDEKPVVSSS
jgi:transcriptional regulator with XRE-family HTH domain